MAYLNEAGVTALWNKLKKRDLVDFAWGSSAEKGSIAFTFGDASTEYLDILGATETAAGLMSAEDKTKLDSLGIDDAFSTSSTNAVQNKVLANVFKNFYHEVYTAPGTHTNSGKSYATTDIWQWRILLTQENFDTHGIADLSGAIGFNSEQFAQSSGVSNTYSLYDLLPDQTFTTVKVNTPAAGDNSTLCATTAFVQNAINTALTSASSFQGTTKDYTTIANTSYKKGQYWVANAAFTLGSDSIEVGDMIFCINTKGTNSATTDFSVVQANLTSIPTTYIDALS